MRVSDQQRYNSFAQNIQQRLTNLTRVEQEVGTGKSIFSPSEDVVRAKEALRAEANLADNTQFMRNIDDGKAWVSSADGALQSVSSLIDDINSLALSADNDTQTEDDRRNTATQINQKLEQLFTIVNTKNGDKYVFGGFNTTNPAFTATRDADGKIADAAANQDTLAGKIYRRIGVNDDIQINIPGNELFQPLGSSGSDQDIFHVIAALRDTIGNNNVPPNGGGDELSNHALRDALDQIKERVTTQETFLGSIGQRLDNTKARLKEVEVNLTDVQEQAEGVDIPSLVTRMSVEQNAYNALLGINSKLMQQSLVDYLK